MNRAQMAFRCPDAEMLETVKIEGYRLAFRHSGVATLLPEPGGVDFLTLMRAVTKVCRTVNLAGCDVNELCPPCDPTGASTAAACKIIREMLIAIVNR